MQIKNDQATFSCCAKAETSSQNVQIDRSIAYEMIHDFGRDAFLQVVDQYQQNMAGNLKLFSQNKAEELQDRLWALQYIRNCSNQLGLATVAMQCRQIMENDYKNMNRNEQQALQQEFELVIDQSVKILKKISEEMQY